MNASRLVRPGPPAAGLATALPLAALLLAAGCQRRTQLVAASSSDSTAAASDSFGIHVREAQERWDDPQGGADAARLTAQLVRRDLDAHANEAWPPRVRALLDSLDVGAEVSADRRIVVVNLFSRAHPEGGSWPWLFWQDGASARALSLSGQGLQLLGVASRPRPDGGAAAAAVLFGRRAASGQEPMLMVWGDLARATPVPTQTLGPDSLGGFGSGRFEAPADSSVALVTTTFRGAPRFVECATCPHMFTKRRFEWGPEGFHRAEEQAVPSPYSSFVRFVAALTAGDADAEQRLAADPSVIEAAKRYEMDVVSHGSWRVAPATDESARDMVFFRGQKEAFTVSFEPRGDDWVITGIVPAARTVE